MTQTQQRQAAKKFSEDWKDKGYEKGESQKFWLDLLCNVYGVQDFASFVYFENQIKDKFQDKTITNFIDVYIPSTKVMIEQKSSSKDLRTPIKQSDGSLLTPFQQARKYISGLPLSKHPRWIITCNFDTFLVYDMENPNGEPEEILLENLEKEYYRLAFIADTGNEHLKKELEVSKKAGDIIGDIYDKFLEQYKKVPNLDMEKCLKSLNMLCVRLVFCLYAEDAGIFGGKNMFGDYIAQFEAKNIRKALLDLFKKLDEKEDVRDPFDEELNKFPYVNGGLFTEEDILIPNFTDEIKDLLIKKASSDFNWSEISPTIFGALFESTLNPETRRSGGMHYTSIENIHKVIDPLFLDDLRNEFEEIKQIKTEKIRDEKLVEFQKKLGSLKFLDPACGSGNFLTETYLSLRKLENECLRLRFKHGALDLFDDTVFVNIHQFYGIEINDFAAVVAKTALWIAESQMMNETSRILSRNLEFLPLKSYANIVKDNALTIDWETVIPKNELNYIMGNPPFVGFTYMNADQKEDMELIFPGIKNLDFVCAWYKKANEYIKNTKIECAFVSTNSITQGETVSRLWDCVDFTINFAYKSFIWDSEANLKAHVHCVIVGFADFSRKEKWLYSDKQKNKASNINAYLTDAPNIIVKSRNKPLCNIPKMIYGNKPADGGFLIIEDCDYENFVKKDPESVKFIKPLLGAVEFLHNEKRWCLWLDGADPSEIKKCPLVMDRIKKCKENRENSVAAGIRKFAATPTLFAQITQPVGKSFILVPRVSSENRRYVPMDFLDGNTIVSDAVQIVPEASLYDFGILTSNVHMAWMRAVCGRLESRYRYSKDVVYNNFAWCTPTDEQKEKIEKTAQAILDARAKYPKSSLADLYDETLMPPELRRAHQENDRAVMAAYGFNTKMTESECVAELFKLYEKLTK
ncbi:MAG: N-6 DNA methylase [Treponema sp.]|nr:N-6 DNA methylase [Treponema sp.]